MKWRDAASVGKDGTTYQRTRVILGATNMAARAQATEIMLCAAAGYDEPVRADMKRRAQIANGPPDMQEMQKRLDELEAENRPPRRRTSRARC